MWSDWGTLVRSIVVLHGYAFEWRGGYLKVDFDLKSGMSGCETCFVNEIRRPERDWPN
jgi:hypothetical protein